MELRIKERLLLPTFLPQEGTFMEYNLKKSILQKVSLTDSERTEVELIQNKETDRIEWNTEKDVPVNLDFTTEERAYLKAACEKLSESNFKDEVWASVDIIYNSLQD